MYTVYNRKNERLSGHALKLAVNECNLFKILTFSKILGMNKTLQCKIICNEYFCYFYHIYIKMSSTSYNISMTTFSSWKGDIFIGKIALIWHYEFFQISAISILFVEIYLQIIFINLKSGNKFQP